MKFKFANNDIAVQHVVYYTTGQGKIVSVHL